MADAKAAKILRTSQMLEELLKVEDGKKKSEIEDNIERYHLNNEELDLARSLMDKPYEERLEAVMYLIY